MGLPPSVRVAFAGQLTIVRIPTVAKCPIVIDIQSQGPAMPITRLLLAVIGLTSVLLSTAYSADAPKQKRGSSGNASRWEGKPVQLVLMPRPQINHTFTYSPYPALPHALHAS